MLHHQHTTLCGGYDDADTVPRSRLALILQLHPPSMTRCRLLFFTLVHMAYIASPALHRNSYADRFVTSSTSVTKRSRPCAQNICCSTSASRSSKLVQLQIPRCRFSVRGKLHLNRGVPCIARRRQRGERQGRFEGSRAAALWLAGGMRGSAWGMQGEF